MVPREHPFFVRSYREKVSLTTCFTGQPPNRAGEKRHAGSTDRSTSIVAASISAGTSNVEASACPTVSTTIETVKRCGSRRGSAAPGTPDSNFAASLIVVPLRESAALRARQSEEVPGAPVAAGTAGVLGAAG